MTGELFDKIALITTNTSADEDLIALGYELSYDKKRIFYEKKESICYSIVIEIYLLEKEISIGNDLGEVTSVDFKVYQALFKKINELGWIE